jgi:hypothetical protein
MARLNLFEIVKKWSRVDALLLAPNSGDDFFLYRGRRLLVAVELHRVGRATLSP